VSLHWQQRRVDIMAVWCAGQGLTLDDWQRAYIGEWEKHMRRRLLAASIFSGAVAEGLGRAFSQGEQSVDEGRGYEF